MNGMTYENEGKGEEEEEEEAVIYFIIITCESVFIFIYTKYFSFYNFGAHHTHTQSISAANDSWSMCDVAALFTKNRRREEQKEKENLQI